MAVAVAFENVTAAETKGDLPITIADLPSGDKLTSDMSTIKPEETSHL